MKPFPTRTTCVLILAAAFASSAQDAEKLTASTIANAIEARSAKEPAVWYAKFEIEHEGPAHLFDLPEADYGQRYRYQCIEEWWTDGTRCAVTVSGVFNRFLDDAKLEDQGDKSPQYAYINNGESVTYLDFRQPGGKLVVNSPWPYTNAAVPILFGRGYGLRSYGDVAAKSKPAFRAETHLGEACSVMAWTDDRIRVESWLAKDLDNLCIREVAHLNDILIVDRVFDFEASPSGMRYPQNALERFVASDGSETIKTWRLIEFNDTPKLPHFVFQPSFDNVSVVVDAKTGTLLHGEPQQPDANP